MTDIVAKPAVRRAAASALAGALLLLAGCAAVPSRPVQKADCKSVYIFWPRAEGNHTSLLIRREDFPVPSTVAGWPKEATTDWAEVGFGSREHFDAQLHRRSFPKWRVLFRTPGVIGVNPFSWGHNPEEWSPSTLGYVRLDLLEKDYRKLLDYVKDSFAYDAQGAPIREYDYQGGGLYRSSLDYSFRRICHTWALDGLKEAGVECTKGWVYNQDLIKQAYASNYRRPEACR